MKAEVQLIVQSMDILQNIPYYLLDSDKIITRDIILDMQPACQAEQILSEYTKIYEYSNLNFVLVDVYTQHDSVKLIYCVIIPRETELEKGKWYELEEINELGNPLIQGLVYASSTVRR